MKKEELLKYKPRGKNVIVKSTITEMTDKGIYIPKTIGQDNAAFTFTVVSMGKDVPELGTGDLVYVADAALVPLVIEDADKNEEFFYTVESFIKFRIIANEKN